MISDKQIAKIGELEFGLLPIEERMHLGTLPKSTLIEYHHTVGQYLRNKHSLWENKWEPELDSAGGDCSPQHPDQISQRIIEYMWKRAGGSENVV